MRAADTTMPAEPQRANASRTEEPPPQYTSRTTEPPPEYGLPSYNNAVVPEPPLPAYSPPSEDNAAIPDPPPPAYSPVEAGRAAAPEQSDARIGTLGPLAATALAPTFGAAEPTRPRDAWWTFDPIRLAGRGWDAHAAHGVTHTRPSYTPWTLEEDGLRVVQPPSQALARAHTRAHAQYRDQTQTQAPCPARIHTAHRHCTPQCKIRTQPVSQWEVRRQHRREEPAAPPRQAQVRDMEANLDEALPPRPRRRRQRRCSMGLLFVFVALCLGALAWGFWYGNQHGSRYDVVGGRLVEAGAVSVCGPSGVGAGCGGG